MFLVFRFFFANKTILPHFSREGKGVSSKLMVMVGVYMCYKVLICRIQVISCFMSLKFLKRPIIVPYLFQNDPKNPIFVPYFLLEKSHISHIFFQNDQWAACHKEINVTCNYKIYAEEN